MLTIRFMNFSSLRSASSRPLDVGRWTLDGEHRAAFRLPRNRFVSCHFVRFVNRPWPNYTRATWQSNERNSKDTKAMSNRRPRHKAARGTFQRGDISKQKVEAASVAIGIIKDTKQQAQTALNVISLSQKILFLLEFLGNTWKLTMFEDDRYHRSRFFCRKKTSSSLAQSLNRSFSI